MKFYGYARKEISKGLLEMREVTVSANPDALREIAEFLNKCANEIEQDDGMAWSHEHFAPKSIKVGKNTPEFVVSNPRWR